MRPYSPPFYTSKPVSSVTQEELLRHVMPFIESIARSKSKPNHPDLDYDDLRSEGLLILSRILNSCRTRASSQTCNPRRRRIIKQKECYGMTVGRVKALVVVSLRNRIADLYRRFAVEVRVNNLVLLTTINSPFNTGAWATSLGSQINAESQAEVGLLADIICDLGDDHVEVINLMGLGHSSRDIASQLEVPRSTVRKLVCEVREALAA